jgi:hypothetical protein
VESNLGGARNFPGTAANATRFIQVVPFVCIAKTVHGVFKIVALDEDCNRPLFCSLDAIAIAPANTGDEPSFTTAFDAETVGTEEVIQS